MAEQLLADITDAYESLSRQLKQIARYVEQHRDHIGLDRIQDVAQRCEVQPSAVIRFAKRFGFSGYSEMQKIFRDVAAEYEKRFAEAQASTAAGLLQKMEGAGARISELSPAERKRWADTLPPIAKTWAADLQAKGMPGDQVLNGFMNGLKKAGAQPARDWAGK